ncbi:MAG: antitoxin family protein [Chloroflexi bacterium]|nr:antitoxin family protein [Chloroflexota bacterium]
MRRTLEAVYEDGVLKPLEALDLPEHQRVQVTVTVPADDAAEETLKAWMTVYDGLSQEEITEVEAIALDRSRFMEEAE